MQGARASRSRPTRNGRRMDGMLDVIAHMKPAALARLLTLVAAQAGTDPSRIAARCRSRPRPPRCSPRCSPRPPEPTSADVAEAPLAAESWRAQMADRRGPRAISSARSPSPRRSSRQAARWRPRSPSRARTPTRSRCAPSATRSPQAAADGAFPTVREALRRLDELARQPALTRRDRLGAGDAHRPRRCSPTCARRSTTDADAAIAGEILHGGGSDRRRGAARRPTSAAAETQRSLLRPVLRGMSESVLGVARTRLRTEEPTSRDRDPAHARRCSATAARCRS